MSSTMALVPRARGEAIELCTVSFGMRDICLAKETKSNAVDMSGLCLLAEVLCLSGC